MAGAIAHDQAERLRAALAGLLPDPGESVVGGSVSARDTFLRLVDVLESSAEAVVFPSETFLGTQQAADLLGVSRMTVVRLIDRGELPAEGGGVHRRVAAAELARYRTSRAAARRSALRGLAQDIGEDTDTPPDHVIRTR